jgi:predicted DCC family thiol-disulfide oxidoreductase YuxK
MAAGVVVYDGDCGICEAASRFIRRHISQVDVMSHREYGVSSLASVCFVTFNGRYEGADAVSRILRLSEKRVLRMSGIVIALPVIRIVARIVYFIIAKNRRRISRLFGLKACSVPQAR